MPAYTVSNSVLVNLNEGKRYVTDILFVFSQENNSFKVSIDRTNRILSIYESIAEKNEIISTWLQLMSHKPSSFETIDADARAAKNNEEIFLIVCSATKQHPKMIVFSHEAWENFSYHSENVIFYNGKPVYVLDRDEAIAELHASTKTVIHANNSVVATNNSTIDGAKNG
jgi:hypothetical protein